MRNLTAHVIAVLALALVVSVGLAGKAPAHEVRPAIGDLWLADGEARLVLQLNAEAIVAGIDLDGLTDTNDSAQAQDYDALRALPPETLAARLDAALRGLDPPLALTTGDATLPLMLRDADVAPVGDVAQPRDASARFTAQLPPGTGAVRLIWPDGMGALVLRQMGAPDGVTAYLDGGDTSPPVALSGGGAQGGWQVFLRYIPVGFDHILPKGLDHILFVLGLFFLSTRLAPLLWQVSAFTLAHTVTLALGALGWVTLPASIVEPLIAASITYVAVENIFSSRLHRWRPAVVFGFGLLHGLGFASVLGEFGLPPGHFVPALIGFNIGVELGQLAVIALAFLAVGLWFRNKPWYRARIAVPASVVIALIGAWWVIERVFL